MSRRFIFRATPTRLRLLRYPVTNGQSIRGILNEVDKIGHEWDRRLYANPRDRRALSHLHRRMLDLMCKIPADRLAKVCPLAGLDAEELQRHRAKLGR